MTILVIFLGISLMITWWSNKNLKSERDFYKAKAINILKKTRVNKGIIIENELLREYYEKGKK